MDYSHGAAPFPYLSDGQQLDDPEGIGLDSALDAYSLMVRIARSILAEAVMGRELPLDLGIEIADEQWRSRRRLSFRSAIRCPD